jgi:hypothetical protein
LQNCLLNLVEPRGCFSYKFDYNAGEGRAEGPSIAAFNVGDPLAFAAGGRGLGAGRQAADFNTPRIFDHTQIDFVILQWMCASRFIKQHSAGNPESWRWESASVRVAEVKAGEIAPPVDDACYAVAVYAIPLPRRWNSAAELKSVAYLKRSGKENLKPSRVRILGGDQGLATVVNLFPRSMEITG